MKISKRIFCGLLSIALIAVVFTACGGQSPAPTQQQGGTEAAPANPAANDANSQEMITLRIWGGVPPESGPQASIDLFNEAFKDQGIQAEYERFVNDPTGNLKLETSLLAGSDVDVYITYSLNELSKRASGNMALDLSELIARDNYDIVANFGEIATTYYIDGKPYYIPSKVDLFGININKDMFDEAGIEVPTSWTIDDVVEVAKKLTKGEGEDKVYGMYWNTQSLISGPVDQPLQMVFGSNFMYKDETGTETNFDHPYFAKLANAIVQMMNVDQSCPTHIDSVTQKLSIEGMFLSEKAAMSIGSWAFRSIKDVAQYPHDFVTAYAPIPLVEEGQSKYLLGGISDYIAINPKSKNIDAAWEYIKFYTEQGMLPMATGGRVPAYLNYDKDDITREFLAGAENLFDAESVKAVLITPQDGLVTVPITNKLPEITKAYTEELEAIFSGQKTAEQGFADAKRRGDEFLK